MRESEVSLLSASASSEATLLKLRIPAKGRHFVSGLAYSYDEASYPEELSGLLTSEELRDIVRRLNCTIQDFWPCSTVMAIGYVFIPCTLGLSLLCPSMCVGEAELAVERFLESQTYKAKFFDRKISFRLVKSCCSCSKSYVEISLPSSLVAFAEDNERGWLSPSQATGIAMVVSQQPQQPQQPKKVA